jgi:hypothetical protein
MKVLVAACDQPMTRMTVEFEWQDVGRVSLDEEDRLVFPVLPQVPGLYQFRIESSDDRPSVYVGEAAELRRRMQNYGRRAGGRRPISGSTPN